MIGHIQLTIIVKQIHSNYLLALYTLNSVYWRFSTITNELGILTFSMHEVDRYGISTVVERAVESVNPRYKRILSDVMFSQFGNNKKSCKSVFLSFILKMVENLSKSNNLTQKHFLSSTVVNKSIFDRWSDQDVLRWIL